MAQAIGAIDGQLGVEHRTCRRFGQRFDGDAGGGEAVAQLLRREGQVDKFGEPLVEDFHGVRSAVRIVIRRDIPG